jgi:hypothetical protein
MGGHPRVSLQGAEVCERMTRSYLYGSSGDSVGRKTSGASLFWRVDAEEGPANRIVGTAHAAIL